MGGEGRGGGRPRSRARRRGRSQSHGPAHLRPAHGGHPRAGPAPPDRRRRRRSAAAALLVGGWFLVHTSLFSARSVTVTGNVHETAAQVVAQAGLATHPPLLDVERRRRGRQASSSCRGCARPRVHVSWPDGVHIAVTEETPASPPARPPDQWGRIERRRPGPERVGHPPPGPAAPDGAAAPRRAGNAPCPSRTRPASRLPRRLPASFAGQVTASRSSRPAGCSLALTTPILVDIGSATQLTAKYEDVSSILSGATLHNGDVIDVSVPDAADGDARGDGGCLTSPNGPPYGGTHVAEL